MADLFILEKGAFGRFTVYYLGERDDPEIVILDHDRDRYSFDSREWNVAETSEAADIAIAALVNFVHAETLIGVDDAGHNMVLGIALKKPQLTDYGANEEMFRLIYPPFPR